MAERIHRRHRLGTADGHRRRLRVELEGDQAVGHPLVVDHRREIGPGHGQRRDVERREAGGRGRSGRTGRRWTDRPARRGSAGRGGGSRWACGHRAARPWPLPMGWRSRPSGVVGTGLAGHRSPVPGTVPGVRATIRNPTTRRRDAWPPFVARRPSGPARSPPAPGPSRRSPRGRSPTCPSRGRRGPRPPTAGRAPRSWSPRPTRRAIRWPCPETSVGPGRRPSGSRSRPR